MTSRRAWLTRILLRRRHVDPWLLGAGFVLLGLLVSIGKVVLLFFAACGLYLAVTRPRSWRAFPPAFTSLLLAWSLWQIGLSLARGEPVAGNRTLSYAGIELALAFLPPGLALVRDPVGALAIGARACLVLLAVVTPIAFLLGEDRVGLGGNEAIFAFVIGVVALCARLEARYPLRLLPNSRWWTYLVAVPVLLSGTRAAFVIVVLAALPDMAWLARLRRPDWMRTRKALTLAVALGLLAAVGVGVMAKDRIADGMREVKAFERSGVAAGSVDTRLVMWSAGWQVLIEHPALGVGGTHRMAAAGEKAGRNGFMVTYYQHLHNMYLDEALSSGLVGVGLMLSVFGAFLATVWRASRLSCSRSTAALLVGFTLLFGSFHGVLLNEWTLITLFGAMSCMLAATRRGGRRVG